MEKNEILLKLQDIFRDVLDDESLIIKNKTTADDVEGWDSLTHVQIVEETQKTFGVKFTAYEMSSWIDVEEMVDCIAKKLS